ncbi:MAG TPA: glutamine synthetase type III [Elusimicrobia bacterium]|nr:MAG: glutamine synthetase [Elusimicrobia bacterium RIFOXYA12_FULL_49_49]OGS14999.1 MAG: glutamine synthetase [Elusimicrobia bacterium RIFOXYA2_FULL_47_53]OGS26066.1 MAG: glutamine synthetase [Elusimicrobia bacterium RIFOXYB12_FULL_50_12]OGS29343.1 MAG: glutamine synthetase [Elusimicrobia bacterium RIFOXYB2_FULL_46_23]HBU70300.1 glutamine synthetase type III [Elusimicrobiota bacterium]
MAKKAINNLSSTEQMYGQNVFGIKNMRKYLSQKTYNSLVATIREGRSLDPKIADEVAGAMKKWAVLKGATHFTHWFQPLTGGTAEKHDSFIVPDGEGGVMMKFSGKELTQGEPDASSFPSGGLRATFEARGYTAWDPTSPAFVKESESGAVLCIPTAFYSYNGEALDKKTPLLRSIHSLAKQVNRLAKLFNIKGNVRPYATLGAEQEYFLIDKEFYLRRLDLLQTGRTLFGRRPSKHQQMEDHYFGAIKPRVLEFMEDLDRELWKLGIPSKTRHNEVCPAQFEIAPVFEEQNLAVDHNMMTMEVLRQLADKHDFVCLLHEKPFAGVNGSGKHNNWALCGPDGKNWLTPGDNPHENAKFLTVIAALMKAIDTNAGMLRGAVATAGNDHRLGANEAPPAILSIFLGEQLTDIIDQIEKGGAKSSKEGGTLEVGVTSLPKLARDVTDRNRTSPFAFTGNKFEFRAVGSNQNCAGPNIVLNTIVAEALDEICTDLEAAVKSGKDFNESLQGLLQKIVKKHKRILFNGDNYTEEWHKEAEKRGLLNLKTTPDALEETITPAVIKLFEKHSVLSKTELESRYEIYKEQYEKTIKIESGVALEMAKTLISPAVVRYQKELAGALSKLKKLEAPASKTSEHLSKISGLSEDLFGAIAKLDEVAGGHSMEKIIDAMKQLRAVVDSLEEIMPRDTWPLPTYAEMMFLM